MGFQNEILVPNLSEPTGLAFAPDGRMLIMERSGRIRVVQPGATQPDATALLQLTNIDTREGERGLVGLALDPNFSTNGYYYVFYTAASPLRDRVSRFTASGSSTNLSTEQLIWQDNVQAGLWHHGGAVAVGPDGLLYISTGDHFDQPGDSQSLTSYHGKILRVNADGSVPTSNPFYDGAGPNLDAIWARGLRNPYRFSFDSANGRMYIGDVGGNSSISSIEEVNVGAAGANYGWPVCEGACGTVFGMNEPALLLSAQQSRLGGHRRLRVPRQPVSGPATTAATSTATTFATGSRGSRSLRTAKRRRQRELRAGGWHERRPVRRDRRSQGGA